eukprot:4105855-Pleurochrysis_carterae.AAC.1
MLLTRTHDDSFARAASRAATRQHAVRGASTMYARRSSAHTRQCLRPRTRTFLSPKFSSASVCFSLLRVDVALSSQ